jgi:hypothetical protein
VRPKQLHRALSENGVFGRFSWKDMFRAPHTEPLVGWKVGLAWARDFSVDTEVERQHLKFCPGKRSSLLFPALLIAVTPVGEHDTSVTFSVSISVL